MKLNRRRVYVLTAFVFAFILIAAGFLKYWPNAHKTSTAFNKPWSALLGHIKHKNLSLPACKKESLFSCTAEYLQYLHYLPISYEGRRGYRFQFAAPSILRSVANSYAWNSQNPFFLGAIAQYLEASGQLRDGEYAKTQINKTLLYRLKKSAEKGRFNRHAWKWVLVRQAKKGEKVTLYANGKKIFSSPINTGEFGTTPDGTWYVFLRFRDTTMSGLSPKRISKKVYASLKTKHSKDVGCLDGHPVKWISYDDSGIKYVDYFNKGIALHYIKRPRYGFPQSAGCVEIPRHAAGFLYKNTGYGTIVTVIGSAGKTQAKKHEAGKTSDGLSCSEKNKA